MAKFRTDRTAQQLWIDVAAVTNAIDDLVTAIPASTVRGPETRDELRRVRGLLAQAVQILTRTEQREGARYTEADAQVVQEAAHG